jgi:hypothetical protein
MMIHADGLRLWLQVLLGMMAFWAVFLTIVFRLEKRTVSPYGEMGSSPCFGDPTGYGASWVGEAVRAGFVFLGWTRDSRGPIYRCSYALLVSADRTTFAVVGVGTILKIPLQATWLHTPAMDGRSFNTTDKQSGVQIDLSGNWTNQLAIKPTFSELLHKHQEWLQSLRVLPRSFPPNREFEEFKALRDQHFRHMERAGLIRFTDASATQFYYTFAGAAKTAMWGYLVGLARGMSHGAFPRSA